jgi:hypothetical protein
MYKQDDLICDRDSVGYFINVETVGVAIFSDAHVRRNPANIDSQPITEHFAVMPIRE